MSPRAIGSRYSRVVELLRPVGYRLSGDGSRIQYALGFLGYLQLCAVAGMATISGAYAWLTWVLCRSLGIPELKVVVTGRSGCRSGRHDALQESVRDAGHLRAGGGVNTACIYHTGAYSAQLWES